MPTHTHPEPLASLTPQICASAASYHPRFASHRLHPSHTFLSFSRSPPLAAPADHRRLWSRYTRSDHQPARGSAYYITRARSSRVNDLQQPVLKIVPHDDSRISERHHDFSLLRKFIRFIRRFLVAQVRRLLRAFFNLWFAAQRRVLRAFYVLAYLLGSWSIYQRLWENTQEKWNSQANSAARRNDITSALRALNSRCRCR